MSLPSLKVLTARAREIVLGARKNGTLTTLTPKLVFRQLEQEYELEEKAISHSEHKDAIKEAIKAAAKSEDADAEEPAQHEEVSSGKPKSKQTKKAAPRKRKIAVASDEEAKDEEEAEVSKPKKRKVSVPSEGDAEDPAASDVEKPSSSAKEKKVAKTTRPGAKRTSSKQKTVTSSEFVDEDSDGGGQAKPSTSSASSSKAAQQAKPKPSSDEEKADAVAKSDSEMSVLEDDPPKKGRKPKAKTASKEPKKRTRKAAEPLSKDEERIKKLKKLVTECGVRKVWQKEFKDLDRPSQQITRLEAILRELGMKGRFSSQQAKEIKERREFAEELQEVKAFEQRHTRNKRAAPEKNGDEEMGDSDDASEGEAPAAKRTSARARIAAFLQDQSDDE